VYARLLTFLRCPVCGGALRLATLAATATADAGDEVSEGLLRCEAVHVFPVVRGVPRLLADSLREHLPALRRVSLEDADPAARILMDELTAGDAGRFEYDARTRASFSSEWEHHELGDKTWGMELDYRVDTFFVGSIGLSREELDGRVLLDAGCGNGSQSVAYTALGLEVIAIDLSSGVEHGQAFRARYPGARPDRVHFIQADLQRPPLADACVDIIHSAGVLHHTPGTEQTFRRLCRVLGADGTFYVWLYKYERIVTPVVNTIRRGTVRLSAPAFDRLARAGAGAFRAFCAVLNRTGVRSYPPLTQREAALALTDIFGVPYAHYHSFPEVQAWFRSEGFDEIWPANESRRGFGVCGRRRAGAQPG
jgi:ubiquinone/menaquinone biosynthesis C-methylase UbiE/uncharacterized protein YbaR (Trm112 family)